MPRIFCEVLSFIIFCFVLISCVTVPSVMRPVTVMVMFGLARRLWCINFFKTVQQDKETHYADKDVKQKIRKEACDATHEQRHTNNQLKKSD